MPVYEFYCRDCHMLFNFFSKTINTTTQPKCPQCKVITLERQISLFSITGNATQDDDVDELPFDENKMEQAMKMLAKEADSIDEEDPRQAAHLMRKMTDMTGMELGSGMREAIRRMENGEDPDTIESEMGEIIEEEAPFLLPGKKARKGARRHSAPGRDDTLYDL